MSYECYMNVTFRFCFRSPLKSLKLPVFKGLSTDLGSHSFLHISFYPLYKVVSSVKVTPSNNNEKYYVTFAEDDYVNSNYGGKDFSLLMGRMGDLEKMGKVKNYNWATSNLLNTGEKTISNTEVATAGLGLEKNISAGKKYHVIVIGVSDDGLQTTEISRLDLTAPNN